MSKRKILAALKKKGIEPVDIEYVRGDVVPEGYANGWDIEFSEATDIAVWDAGFKRMECFMQFDTTQEVLDFVAELPDLSKV